MKLICPIHLLCSLSRQTTRRRRTRGVSTFPECYVKRVCLRVQCKPAAVIQTKKGGKNHERCWVLGTDILPKHFLKMSKLKSPPLTDEAYTFTRRRIDETYFGLEGQKR